MILLHVVSSSKVQIEEIIDFLIDEKLILEPIILERVQLRKKDHFGQFQNISQFLMMAKARALLFGKIELLLKKKYKENLPDLYSLPIVNMDWEKAEILEKPKDKPAQKT